jgi:L-threonylcarbamoyladenylate synthase
MERETLPRILDPSPDAIREAARRLRDGGVVAFPTETVYGLGADTASETGLARVYDLKGRPDDNPLIAHVLGANDARTLVAAPDHAPGEPWSERCAALARHFWPGPLTLVLPRAECVPDRATAGLPTIAVRSPRHAVARALLEAFGGPISAPSANRSGHVSPTTPRHVADDFPEAFDLVILDGGPCDVGIESTVLDLTGDPPRILRPGSVSEEALREIVPDVVVVEVARQAAAPGTSPHHYAPRTPAEMVAPDDLAGHLEGLRETAVVLCFDPSVVPPPHRAIEMPQGAGDYARRLYDDLRRADALDAARIVVERPPDSNAMWRAIVNRLRRATRTP